MRRRQARRPRRTCLTPDSGCRAPPVDRWRAVRRPRPGPARGRRTAVCRDLSPPSQYHPPIEWITMLQLSEEFSAGRARLRVDVHGSTSREHVLEHMAFLNYRLASVHREPTLKLSKPDLVWYQDDDNTNVSYDGSTMTLTGESVSYTHLRAHETDSYLVCR